MIYDLVTALNKPKKKQTLWGMHYIDGEWVIVRSVSGKTSIVVTCPRCNREGKLTRYVRRGGVRRYIIFHAHTTCQFSRSDKAYDHLDKVYRTIKEGGI